MPPTARLIALVALGVTTLACSGDDGAADLPADASPVVSVGDVERGSELGSDGGASPTTVAPVERTVSVSVRSDELGLDAELVSSAVADGDPFADFAACSGLRDTVSSYSVSVGVTDGPIRWVSVNSAARVAGSGIIDADVRVERTLGDPIEAVGTMTIDPGLSSGSFVAFDPEGRRLDGRFECRGDDVPPMTLEADTAGVVEVVALLERGTADRVVGLASADPAAVSCPAGRDTAALVVRVDGDLSVGGITTFELATTGAGSYTLRLRIGAVVYEFDQVDVELLDPASGSFSAGDGITSVAGAFTCT